MILPNFLIVGAQKCGTTSLHDILSKHPEAGMSEIKEINYFTFDDNYKEGLDYYSSFFKDIDNNKVAVGESSPGYMCYPGLPERIYKNLGNIKIVIILRDPIKRAFSQYWDNRRHLNEYLTEKQIVEKYLEKEYQPGRRGYFSRGVYISYIKKYFDLFGEKNIHIILLEELMENQKSELHRLYLFLGLNKNMGLQMLPPPSNASTIWVNPIYNFFFVNPSLIRYLPSRGKSLLFFGRKVKYKYRLPDEWIINKIKHFYEPFNEELEKFLDKPLKQWL